MVRAKKNTRTISLMTNELLVIQSRTLGSYMVMISVGMTRSSSGPSRNENPASAVCSLPIHLGALVSLRLSRRLNRCIRFAAKEWA